MTIVLGLDQLTEDNYQANHPTGRSLKISNVENYYNFQSLGNIFKLVTSLLSNSNNLIDLARITKIEAGKTTDSYSIRIENPIVAEKMKLHEIVTNQRRMRAGFVQVANQIDRPHTIDQTRYNDFFGHEDQMEEEHVARQGVRPDSCFSSVKKRCDECCAPCTVEIEGLLDRIKPTGQKVINEELHRHGHPKSRMMPNGQLRITYEGAQELLNHYVFAHKKKLPIIL